MKKPIYNPIDIKLGFQEVIDSDFNPDIVHLFGIEMWDAGFKQGVMIGVTGSLIVGSLFIMYRVYKDVKQSV